MVTAIYIILFALIFLSLFYFDPWFFLFVSILVYLILMQCEKKFHCHTYVMYRPCIQIT